MKKSKVLPIFLVMFLFLFSLPLIIAQPPFEENVNPNQGLQIFEPQLEAVKQNAQFNLHIHVSNISTGFPLTNDIVDCKVHLYDNTGNHTFESEIMNKDSNGFDHEIFISKGNFSRLGEHAYYIWCNNSFLGGEGRGTFQVTRDGHLLGEGESRFYFALLFAILLLFGFFLIIGLKTPFENKKEMTKEGMAITKITKGKYVKVLAFWGAYGFFLWFITIVSGMSNNYIFFEGTTIMINRLLLYLNILGKGINWTLPFLLLIMTWKDIILNKKILKNGRALLKEF